MKYEGHGRYVTDSNKKVICEVFSEGTGKQKIKNAALMVETIVNALNEREYITQYEMTNIEF